MAYLFEQLGSDEYWTRFAARVRPHLGDLQALFKHPWRSGFSMEFSDFERSLCREALRRRAPIEHWVLRYLPTSRQPGAELAAHGERYAFGFTLEQVVARLHEDCFDRQFLPTSVSLAEADLRFEFYDGEELFACIERVKFCTAPAGSARSAAETFLATLAAGGRDETSVLQMLAEWPGAQGLQVAKLQGSFRRIVTPPTLDNWVTQTTELLRRAPAKPDTPQAARELVAAVMDAASFEALEQAMNAHAATGVYPVLVESEVQGGSVHFDVYPDILQALPGFVELATQVTAEVPGSWEFEAGSYSSEFAIEFRRVPSDESTQPASQQSRSVSLATLPIADHDEASGAACAALAHAGSDVERFTLLREIFLIDRPASERTREIDRHNDQKAIYEDRFGLRMVVKGELPKTTWSDNGAVRRGNVVFAFASATPDDGGDDNYADEPGKIHIERIDEHGGVLCQTLSVPLDEAGLLYSLEERAWVLTSGPCFRTPRGVIRGIDDGGLRVLYFVLGCNRGGPATDFITELTMRSPEFQEEMAELIRDGLVV